MDFASAAKLIQEIGIGVGSFLALCWFGWNYWKWMQTVTDNHLTHLQESMDAMLLKQDRSNELLEKLIQK